ncbi:hypothetical protein BU15DRAFT_54822, partial [Melanogaster broomeanus]
INVVLFGEKGVGKSSIVNLLAGKELVMVFRGRRWHSVRKRVPNSSGRQDVLHLGYGWPPTARPGDQIHGQRLSLMQSRMRTISYGTYLAEAELDLLLLCMRSGITVHDQRNYKLFYDVLCGQKVPIGAVITHLEQEVNMEDWWTRNGKYFDRYNIKLEGHTCVTALPPGGGMGNRLGNSTTRERPSKVYCRFITTKRLPHQRAASMEPKKLLDALTRCGFDPDLAGRLKGRLNVLE